MFFKSKNSQNSVVLDIYIYIYLLLQKLLFFISFNGVKLQKNYVLYKNTYILNRKIPKKHCQNEYFLTIFRYNIKILSFFNTKYRHIFFFVIVRRTVFMKNNSNLTC